MQLHVQLDTNAKKVAMLDMIFFSANHGEIFHAETIRRNCGKKTQLASIRYAVFQLVKEMAETQPKKKTNGPIFYHDTAKLFYPSIHLQ